MRQTDWLPFFILLRLCLKNLKNGLIHASLVPKLISQKIVYRNVILFFSILCLELEFEPLLNYYYSLSLSLKLCIRAQRLLTCNLMLTFPCFTFLFAEGIKKL